MTPIPVISPAKHLRAQQILKCVELVAAHFEVEHEKVLTAFAPKTPGISSARALLWHHLHQCGMSFNAMSRIWKLSTDHISKEARNGRIRMLPEEAELLAALPMVENTLDIRTANSIENSPAR